MLGLPLYPFSTTAVAVNPFMLGLIGPAIPVAGSVKYAPIYGRPNLSSKA